MGEVIGREETDPQRRKEREKEAAYSLTQAFRLLNKDKDDEEQMLRFSQVYVTLAVLLLDLRLEDLAEYCLAQVVRCRNDEQGMNLQSEGETPGAVIPPEHTADVGLLFGRLHSQVTAYDKAEAVLQTIIRVDPQATAPRLLLGDVFADQGKSAEAVSAYDGALRIDSRCADWRVYLKMGTIFLAIGSYEDARDAFILGTQAWPCGLTWQGMGVAYYRLGDYRHAEQALNEANVLNNLHPVTWAYLAMVCLKTAREDEADRCYDQAVLQGLSNAELLTEIAREQFARGRMAKAEEAYRRSIELDPKAMTHLLLGATLTAMRRFNSARQEYNAVMSAPRGAEGIDEADLKARQEALDQMQLMEELGI
eukprot:NODE_564_length_1350_cov_106.049962_g439_i0.p2 GENE.NODE_564_length_1350_cov_106.049962_g439_i0~~NODE_564_length_1350_cov_106.049962_g439_i0.p2  ORF type:complete len:373 (-),score=162.29 NODE_564_length_1350_cov_106.049962_g439_i0:231-1328(-)